MFSELTPASAATDDYPYQNRKLVITGIAIGFAYGFTVRLLPRLWPAWGDPFVMTAGFTCFLPFAMGFTAVFFAEVKRSQGLWTWLLLPWVPLVAALAATMVVQLEGLLCVVMFAPLGLVLSSLGGVLGGAAARLFRSRRSRQVSVACVILLPFMVAPWEEQVFRQWELRRVENVIDIHAPAQVIWTNIGSVRPIHTNELPSSWSHRIGFPDPVAATLSHEGIGGVRDATFTGGVSFIETVDVWEPEQRLAFSIHPEAVPEATLDGHVRIGGPYFDVLRAEYRLEPLADGTVRLHLSSQHRLSTGFNWYAHLWTDAIMADLQMRILHVIKQRCERDKSSN